MSYNIDTWKTKKLDDFQIPISALQNHNRKIILEPDVKITVEGPVEIFDLKGTIQFLSDTIFVEEIYIAGEGSGSYHDTLKNIFSQSQGTLEAILVWEGGDSITRLTVVNGVVTEERVEL